MIKMLDRYIQSGHYITGSSLQVIKDIYCRYLEHRFKGTAEVNYYKKDDECLAFLFLVL